MGSFRILLAALVLVASWVPAQSDADTWIPPTRKAYESPHKTARFTVEPRSVDSQLAYFEARAGGQELPGDPPRGTLERRQSGRWIEVWRAPLVNDTAPVSALVSDDGAYVATFDNWHSMGFGPDVVVIYRSDGSLIRKMSLQDILPEDYVRALPRSVSSLWWSGEHRLKGDQLLLSVVIPSNESLAAEHDYVQVTIDLATGKVLPPSGPAWDRAMSAARPIATRDKAAEARSRAILLAPLVAPVGQANKDWTRYMYQAASRLEPSEELTGFRPVWVLLSSNCADFLEQSKAIRDALAGWDDPSGFAIVAPSDPEALVRLLDDGAKAAKPGSLKGIPVFIAVPDRLTAATKSALAVTGARAIVFDPAKPLAQAPETLQRLGTEPNLAEAEAARSNALAADLEAQADELDKLAPPMAKQKQRQIKDDEAMEEMADELEAAADAVARSEPK